MKKTILSLAAMALSAATGTAMATTYSLTITDATVPYDGTATSPVPGDGAPGFGPSSLAGNATGYTKYFVSPTSILGRNVTVNDITSVSFWTKKGTTHAVSAPDWFFQMYTQDPSGSASNLDGKWFDYRIQSEPYFAQNLTDPSNTWNLFSSDPGNNQLRFYVSQAGSVAQSLGSYTDGNLNDLKTSVVRGKTVGNDIVTSMGLATGTAYYPGFSGQVDGLTINLSGGDSIVVNFEAVPLPAAAWAGMVLLGSLVGTKGLKRLRRQQA